MKLNTLFEGFSSRLHKAELDSSDMDSELAANQSEKIVNDIDIVNFKKLIYKQLINCNKIEHINFSNSIVKFRQVETSFDKQTFPLSVKFFRSDNYPKFIILSGNSGSDLSFDVDDNKITINYFYNSYQIYGNNVYMDYAFKNFCNKIEFDKSQCVELTIKNTMIISKLIIKYLTGTQDDDYNKIDNYWNL